MSMFTGPLSLIHHPLIRQIH